MNDKRVFPGFCVFGRQLLLGGDWPDDMTREEALEASIRKWRFIVENIDDLTTDGGIYTCALCHLFYDEGCEGCPVSKTTGLVECLGTPYEDWVRVRYDVRVGEKKRMAERELAFLKSLRK